MSPRIVRQAGDAVDGVLEQLTGLEPDVAMTALAIALGASARVAHVRLADVTALVSAAYAQTGRVVGT